MKKDKNRSKLYDISDTKYDVYPTDEEKYAAMEAEAARYVTWINSNGVERWVCPNDKQRCDVDCLSYEEAYALVTKLNEKIQVYSARCDNAQFSGLPITE